MAEHPITPPAELLCKWTDQWIDDAAEDNAQSLGREPSFAAHIATQAARWGADAELEACCKWLVVGHWFAPDGECINDLRAARRPEPPSEKEEALSALSLIMSRQKGVFDAKPFDTIRRALERLQELENNG